VGTALAALHRAGADFPAERKNALGPDGWGPLLARAVSGGGADGLAAELSGALDEILAAWPVADKLPRGAIHADLFPDNVFFLDGAVSGLIDFYFAATDLFAYDLAICLNAWCFEADLSFNVTKGRAMIRAYDSARALARDEYAALPVLCRGAALRFALTRLYDWLNTPADALVTRKDPMEYVRRLRFHRAAADAGAYGA
jgi:homoserine kinase type II